jgi:hypothetical protein
MSGKSGLRCASESREAPRWAQRVMNLALSCSASPGAPARPRLANEPQPAMRHWAVRGEELLKLEPEGFAELLVLETEFS